MIESAVITAPQPVFVGGSVIVHVAITCSTPVDVSSITLELVGSQWTVDVSTAPSTTVRNLVPESAVCLGGAGTLPVGLTRLAASFEIPDDAAPTHAHAPSAAYLSLDLYIHDTSGSPMFRHHVDLPLRLPPSPCVESTPIVAASAWQSSSDPRLELSLASTSVVAGGQLTGTLAIYNFDDTTDHPVKLRLLPEVGLTPSSPPHWGRFVDFTIPVAAGQVGTTIPFSVDLPADATPTFRARGQELTWKLVARCGGLWRKAELMLGLAMYDRTAIAVTGPLVAPPPLTNELVAGVLASFAQAQGWRTAHDPRAHVLAVEQQTPDGLLRIAFQHRGEDGTFLVSQVASPTLGIGLEVVPGPESVFFYDIEVDIDAWDSANVVHARSAEQATPVLKAVVPAMMACDHLGTLVQWTDTNLVVERAAAGVDLAELDAMAGQLAGLASVVTAARAAVAPPLPVDRTAWVELAASVRGTLSFGDLSIRGVLDGDVPVTLGLCFHGATPVELLVMVGRMKSVIPVTGTNLDPRRVRALVMDLRP